MGSPFAMKRSRNRIHEMSLALQSSLSAPNADIPSVASIRDKATKVGGLKKIVGRGILTLGQGTWKTRYCLLVKNKLYYYEDEECQGTEKGCGSVNLDYFDICSEASTRMARKASNVFVIGSDRGFFDSASSGRHYFSAESPSEMREWIQQIRAAMKNSTPSSKDKKERSQSRPNMKTKSEEFNKTKNGIEDGNDTLPRSEHKLESVTKNRVKGPPGRRLPRKASLGQTPGSNYVSGTPEPFTNGGALTKNNASLSRDVLDLEDDDGIVLKDPKGRATSLSALEVSDLNRGNHHHHRETHIPTQPPPKTAADRLSQIITPEMRVFLNSQLKSQHANLTTQSHSHSKPSNLSPISSQRNSTGSEFDPTETESSFDTAWFLSPNRLNPPPPEDGLLGAPTPGKNSPSGESTNESTSDYYSLHGSNNNTSETNHGKFGTKNSFNSSSNKCSKCRKTSSKRRRRTFSFSTKKKSTPDDPDDDEGGSELDCVHTEEEGDGGDDENKGEMSLFDRIMTCSIL